MVIGPKQLPEVARVVGRLLTELRRATQDLSGGLLEVTRDVRSSIDETKEKIIMERENIKDSFTKSHDLDDNSREKKEENELTHGKS